MYKLAIVKRKGTMSGKHHSQETKDKIRDKALGRKHGPCSDETRKKISKIHKGKKVSDEQKLKQSITMKGRVSPRKGVHLTEETKQKLRDANLGKHVSEETKLKIGNTLKGRPVWNTGKKYKSPKQSIAMSGNKNSNWRGGISENQYPLDWTDLLRESIRERDLFVCQECGVHQDELTGRIRKLHVHHIDYNKDNLNPDNLISLCNSCHMKTNFNREYWMQYFNNKTYE